MSNFKVGDLVIIKTDELLEGESTYCYSDSVWKITKIDGDSVNLYEKDDGFVEYDCFFIDEKPFKVMNEQTEIHELDEFPISLIEEYEEF